MITRWQFEQKVHVFRHPVFPDVPFQTGLHTLPTNTDDNCFIFSGNSHKSSYFAEVTLITTIRYLLKYPGVVL